jgi:GH18 family chitinase/aryl-phospho-beta-D-glucosidase BglC (GH1 family)/PKD repeat protein
MAGTASFTVQVKDSVAAVATRDLALTVASSSTPVTPPVTPPVTLPTLAVGDATLTLSAPTSAVTTNGYLSASGNQIVDAAGNPVRIAGVNWFGFETGNKVFHGLWTRGYKSMLDQLKGLGFNTLRIPYSNEMLRSDAVTTSINYAQNPDLQGLTPIQCLDKVIDYAGSIGLKVILDRHSAKADGYIGEDVWYIPGDAYYTEQRWIDDWVMLAKRYSGNATVIGADLFNEPKKSATWGNSAPATDWNKAAERAGNAILAANPNWLIIVEGTEQYNGQTTWWGGNLKGVATYPVVLAKPSKLVYSMHDYPASVFAQTWFSDPAYPKNLADVWYAHWGYIFKNQTAPLLLGEFGSKLLTTSDQQWMDKLTDYIDGDLNLDGVKDLTGNQKGMSWTYWSLNPNSGDTGGILNDDWTTVNSLRMSYIQGSLAPLIGVATGSGVTSQTMNFAVTLSAPASAVVSVAYATVDGTAAAGVNYTATSGTLFFAPGETMKTISVVVPGQTLTANKQFTVQLGNVSGATIADGTGAGLIQPAAVVLPAVPVISSAATASGTVGTAFSYQIVASGSPTSYSATGLPAGLTVDATSGVISGTPTAAAASTVTLKATNAGGSGTKTLTITVVAASVTGTLTVLQTIQNDWGTGFTAQVVISNPTSAAVSNWSLGFTFDGKITDIWSAAVASQAGTKWVVSPVAWTSTIPAGGSVTFGYNGTPGTTYKIPVAFLINGTAAGRTTNEGTAVAPVISSAATASGTVGTAFSYQIVASGSPTSYSATGLPAGLTVNATSGVISGTPTATATSTVTLKATNAVGSATKTLTITVAAAPVVTAPVISSATTASGTVGTAFSYQIVASGSPTSYSATGLPAGLTVDATSGVISGTPTAAAASTVTLKATNAGGSGTKTLTITVVAASVTGTLTVLQTIQNDWGTGFTAQVVISNPTSAAVSNWSLGFTFDGKITDIWSAAVASQAGTKWVVSPVAWTSTIPAGGSVTFGYNGTPGTTYKIPVAFLINGTAAGRTTNEGTAVAPVISSAATASGTVGTAFSYQIVASGSPTSYSATGLPAGLTVNATSGVISGTPTATATSTVTLKATNAVGSATKTLTITVAAAPVVTAPVISSATTASGTVGTAFSYQIVASGSPTSYSATGLPAGLTVNATSGLISGTPTVAATSSVALKASNTGGSGSSGLTITIGTALPVVVPGYDKMPTVEQRKIVGYYPNWGIYQKGFPVTKIRGDRMNVINYAFLIPLDRTMPTAWDRIVSSYRGWKYSNYAAYMQQPPGTTLTAGVGLFDEYADAGANSAAEALTMSPAYTTNSNFGQLQVLKKQYPKLKTMVSIGGWTLSAPLYSISRDAQKRADFAKSAVYVIVKYGFDGIDIDWEYPGGGGLDGSGVASTSDGANYNLLLKAIRDEMNRQTAIDGKKYYLSIAGPGGDQNIANFDPKAVSQIADWINIMTYDFHGGWDSYTGINAPMENIDPSAGRANWSVKGATQVYLNGLNGKGGVPAAQLVVGVPFYGRGWDGVQAGPKGDGLGQAGYEATSPGLGETEFPYNSLFSSGVLTYANGVFAGAGGYQRYWNAKAQVPYLYSATAKRFITYDDSESMRVKADYANQLGLGGLMFWELSEDVTMGSTSLLDSIYDRVHLP